MDLWGSNNNGPDIFASPVDIREEFHKVLYGGIDVPAQGQKVILREFNDVPCPGCFSEVQGGSRRLNCAYCHGEGYQFRERIVTMAIFAGVAPVYKPGILGTGQYPIAAYGDTDPDRYTGYCEFSLYPNYERYTWVQAKTTDKLYQVKVDVNGMPIIDPSTGQYIRAAKWKILTITPIRDDNGRVGYFELSLIKENVS